MSQYTTEVRYIVEVNSTAGENATIMEKITSAAPHIFNFDFPIWNEADRLNLEVTLLQKYYMWEIGFETVGLWKFYLNQKLSEIMPYYIKLWETTTQQINFLAPYNVKETFTERGDKAQDHKDTEDASSTDKMTGQTTSETSQSNTTANEISLASESTTDKSINTTVSNNGENDSTTIYSDLPQATLGAINTDYATSNNTVSGKTSDTNTTDTTENGNTSGTNKSTESGSLTGKTDQTANTTEDRTFTNNISRNGTSNENYNRTYTTERVGNPGTSYGQLLREYRESILNIIPLIVQDCADLFMALW